MKKFLHFLALGALLCIPWVTQGQDVADYIFSTDESDAQWITLSDGATQIVASSQDDATSSLTDIGFSFPFGDGLYTQFWANSNGIFSFSSNPATSYQAQFNSSNISANQPKICGITKDLSTGAAGYVKYELTGTAPNRVLVCEFMLNNGSSSSGTNYITWQVQLYESNARVVLVYGTAVASPSYFQIGLSQSSSDLWTINPGTHEATHATAGVATTYSAWPGANRYYQFDRPVFTCPKPMGLAATLTPGNGSIATLSWTKGGEETNWVVEYSTASDFTGATQVTSGFITTNDPSISVNLTGLTPEQTYYARVKADCGGGDESDWCNTTISFTPTNSYTLSLNEGTSTNYYIPLYYYVGSYTPRSQFIIPSTDLTSIQWASIDKLTFYYNSATSNYGSANFSVYLTEVASTTMTSFTDWSSMTNVYTGTLSVSENEMVITFDNPFTYTTGNLLIGINTNSTGTSGTSRTWKGVTGTSGCSRYHTGSSWDSETSSNFLPQVTIAYTPGEAPSCLPPSTPQEVANSVTTNSVQLTWTVGASEEAWDIYYTTSASDIPDENTTPSRENIHDNPFTLEDLTHSTHYYVYVRANCGDEQSLWSQRGEFTTACDVITNFPWSENFESRDAGNFSDPCWVNEHISGGGTQIFKVSSHQLQLPDMSNGTQTKLRLPEMTLPNANYQFTIDVNRNATGSSYTSEGVRVYASTDGEIEGATELGFLYRNFTQTDNGVVVAESAAGWYTYEFPIPFSGTCYIILRGESQYGSSTYMDNLFVEQIPTCSKPKTPVCSARTAHTTTLSWTNGAEGQNAWQIAYKANNNFNPNEASELATATIVDADANPYTIENLEQHTPYYAYVRANCGGEYSNWSVANVNFTTEWGNVTPTGLAVAANTITSDQATASWNAVAGNTLHQSYDLYWAEATVNAVPDEPAAPNYISGITSTSQLLADLTPETQYKVWVRDNCGTDGLSAWSSPVTFTTAQACQTPDNLVASNVTTNSATISWAGYGQTAFNLHYSTDGENWASILGATNPYTFNGTLTSNAAYQVQVQAQCNTEEWSTSLNFTTKCDARDDFPITYGFETSEGFTAASNATTNTLGNCWRNQATSNTGYYYARLWSASSTNHHTGDQSLVLPDKNNFNTTLLAFPPMNFTSANGYHVSFWIYRNSSGANPEGFKVYASNTDTIDANAVELGHYSRNWNIAYPVIESAQGWYNYDFYIPQATITGTVYLIFEGQSYYGNATYVDDITIEEAPTCFPVGTLSYDNVEATSAELTWTLVDNSQGAWVVEYATDESFTDVLRADADRNDAFILDGLVPNTHYWVRVKADCGNDDFGEVSNVVNFTTDIACPAPTDLTLVEATNEELTVRWTENGNVSRWTVSYKEAESTGDFTEVPVDEIPYTIGHLEDGHSYIVKVTSDCENGYPSPAVEATFQTEASCPAPTDLAVTDNSVTAHGATITWERGEGNDRYTIEYAEGSLAGVATILEEGFENGIGGWTMSNCHGSTGINTGAAHSGNNGFRFYYRSNPPQYLISPELTLTGTGTLEFYYKNYSSSYSETFQVGYSTTNNINDFTWGDEITASNTQWTLYSDDNIPATTKYIAIKYTSDDQYYLYIDDITITAEYVPNYNWDVLRDGVEETSFEITGLAPETDYVVRVKGNCSGTDSPASNIVGFTTGIACQAPTALIVGTPTHEEVELSWTENGEATRWVVAFKADGEEEYTERTATANPYTLDGLTENTQYTVKVKADCGDEGFSTSWTNEETFTTAMACAVPTAFTMGDVTTNQASFYWTPGNGNNSWNVYVKKHADAEYPTTANANVTVAPTAETPVTINTLDANTTYDVKIVPDCDATKFLVVENAFTTGYVNLTLPYNTTFEAANDAEWRLVNGTHVNKWTIGTAAGNGEPTRGLYISNNGGTSNAYNTSGYCVVFAYAAFSNFEAAKQYTVSFDWKSKGETGNYDFIRAWIVPDDAEFSANTTGSYPAGMTGATGNPTGWISLDNSTPLKNVDSWQNISAYVTVPTDGTYKLVFMWHQDNSVGTNPPAAIDNVSIMESPKYTVTLAVNDNTMGEVTSEPATLTEVYENSAATLTATPNTGYHFVNWTNNVDDEEVVTNPLNITVTQDITYTANFAINTYAITATANPTEGGEVEGANTYNHGAEVTLTATANDGYAFVNWTKNDVEVSTEATYAFTATEAGDYVANFVPTYAITAIANPTEGGTVTGAGTYAQGATATLTATANTGYTFVNWTEGNAEVSTEATYTIENVAAAHELVANFELNSYAITATANPTEGGTVTGAGTYNYGATATLTATANDGYTFVNWTKGNAVVSTEATYTFPVTAEGEYLANFELNSYAITTNANPTEGGTVTGAGTYNHGEEATLTATANEGYEFVRWTDGNEVVSTSATYSFTVTAARELVANFEYVYENITKPIVAKKWYAIASPVHNDGDNQTVAGVDNLTDGTYDLMRYNEAAGKWESQKTGSGHTGFNTLEQGRGYIYRRSANTTLTFTGLANSGAINAGTTYGCTDNAIKGFNLMGNPYKVAYAPTVDFYTLNTNGTWTAHTTGATVAATEAFMIHVAAAGNYAFAEPAGAKGASEAQPALAFTVSNDEYSDVAYVRFGNGEGLPKISHLNAEAPMLYIPMAEGRYAVAAMEESVESFPLNVNGNGEYTLSVSNSGSFGYLHLIDRAMGADIDLLSQSTYSFRASGSSDRFTVKMSPATEPTAVSAYFVWLEGGNVVVEGNGDLQVFDVTGRQIGTSHVEGTTTFSRSDLGMSHTGVYVMRLNGESQKIVVR